MENETKQLIDILNQIIALLASDGEQHWQHWMIESKRRLLSSDYSGIEHLLSAYGGMGSFNDLIIYQDIKNGKLIWKEGYEDKNDILNNLRLKAWELASYIQKSHAMENTEQQV